MKGILLVVVLAVLVEALVEYGKSISKMFTEGDIKTAVTQIVAILVSVLLCWIAGADMFAAVEISFVFPWVGVVLTGVLSSRGANYLSDFIKKLQNAKGGE
jgi:uncharacterized protein YacL